MTQYDCKQLQLTSKGIYTCQTTANDRKRLQLPQKAYKYDRKQPKITAHELKWHVYITTNSHKLLHTTKNNLKGHIFMTANNCKLL